MSTAFDLKSTLNLPKTDFPMKANLPQAEPKRLEALEGRRTLRPGPRGAEGRPLFVLHDGPPYANGHIHLGTALNKILKDIVVRSRSMAGFDAPYVPGWDCHGLPIELQVDKNLAQEEGDGPRRLPQGLPRLRREVPRHPARRVRAPGHPRASGTSPT